MILITLQKVTDSITFLWITSDTRNVLKSWLKYWKSSLRFCMDKPLLKEASVLTNPSLWKICQRKACSLVGACMTTWSQKISPLKISSFVAHCVKASEVQEPSMRIILKSREKQNRATKKHLNAKPSRNTDIVRKKKALLESTGSRVSQRCWQVFFRSWKWKKTWKRWNLLLLLKSNSFRQTVTEKQGQMKECEKRIKELMKQKEKIVWDCWVDLIFGKHVHI